MRDATKEELQSVDNYINSISERVYTKTDFVKKLEKIRVEVNDKEHIKQGDIFYVSVWEVVNILDKHIEEICNEH